MCWIWFHASSAGEFEDGIEVIRRFREQTPDYKVLVTFFSSSGYEQHKNTPHADVVFYLPLDTRKNARDFYNIVYPMEVIFSRNDIWPNYVRELSRHDRNPYLLSFLCKSDSKFFGFPQRNLYRYTFNSFAGIGAQNTETRELLEHHFGVYNCFEAGNTRIPRILSRARKEFHDQMLADFSSGYFTITVGSALHKDMQFILKCINLLNDEKIRWIIVPHKPAELAPEKYLAGLPGSFLKWSSKEKPESRHKFLWMDTIGILPETYKYSQLAWVGGGFDRIGIHNITEPLARGNYVAFGPNHRSYPEALRVIKLGCGLCTDDPKRFVDWICKIRNHEIDVKPSIDEADERAVDYHLSLMKRESGLE